jgi:hypothetical protein
VASVTTSVEGELAAAAPCTLDADSVVEVLVSALSVAEADVVAAATTSFRFLSAAALEPALL